jgi:hypothetical protein
MTKDDLIAAYLKAKPDILANKRSAGALTPEEQAGNILLVSDGHTAMALATLDNIKEHLGPVKWEASVFPAARKRIVEASTDA